MVKSIFKNKEIGKHPTGCSLLKSLYFMHDFSMLLIKAMFILGKGIIIFFHIMLKSQSSDFQNFVI